MARTTASLQEAKNIEEKQLELEKASKGLSLATDVDRQRQAGIVEIQSEQRERQIRFLYRHRERERERERERAGRWPTPPPSELFSQNAWTLGRAPRSTLEYEDDGGVLLNGQPLPMASQAVHPTKESLKNHDEEQVTMPKPRMKKINNGMIIAERFDREDGLESSVSWPNFQSSIEEKLAKSEKRMTAHETKTNKKLEDIKSRIPNEHGTVTFLKLESRVTKIEKDADDHAADSGQENEPWKEDIEELTCI